MIRNDKEAEEIWNKMPRQTFRQAARGVQARLTLFTEREAWTYYRTAAFGEAIGWTLLITGIGINHYHLPTSSYSVQIAGQIHGSLFIIYIFVSLLSATSLGWNKRRTIIAGLSSVPPYGTLFFETWQARQRAKIRADSHREIVVRAIIEHNGKLFVVQPRDRNFSCLPGGLVGPHETAETALKRLLRAQFSRPLATIGSLRYIHEYSHHNHQRLELFFTIQNSSAFTKAALSQQGVQAYDDAAFIVTGKLQDFRPAPLLTALQNGKSSFGYLQ